MVVNLRKPFWFFALLIASCSLATDSATIATRQPAVIDMGGSNSVQITIPATATAGTAFSVVVTTYGGDCVLQGDTEIAVNGLLAEVRPFDVFQMDASSVGCNRNLILYAHTASVTFTQQGSATVRIYGRRDPGKVDITVDRSVEVR